ncbi:hypothetical protein CFP56_032679 [Quercus suber]|uniref:Uncharacterized protein n=1 Tax=Quercus suber TaxID=58331 RepID=A0AAW0JGV7_QUESU
MEMLEQQGVDCQPLNYSNNLANEQKIRVRKAEHLLKVAEEDMLMAKLEAASISEELVKVHRWWVPRWLAFHLRYFQSYIVTH